MRTNWLSAVLCCLALTLVGCDGMGGRKPASTGLPYEVVLEGDSDSIVTRMMTADMPHLPQPHHHPSSCSTKHKPLPAD